MDVSTVINGSEVSTLRALNTRAVLAQLQTGGAPTVTELSRAIGLSRPTVEAALEHLVAVNLVGEAEAGRGNGVGRPARQFRFRADSGCVAGIDAGPHGLIAILADMSGAELASIDMRADLEEAGAALDAIRSALTGLLAEAGQQPDRLRVVALGVPGVVDADGRLWKSVVVPSWVDVDLVGKLEATFPGARVLVENDTHLAAIAEHASGTVPGADNLVCLLVGHRIGAGVVVNGELLRGQRGAAAEIGALAPLGWTGATERLAAAVRGRTVEEIFAADTVRARRAVDRFAADLALGTAALVLAVAPEAVIVGGGVAAAGEAFLDRMRDALAELCLYEPQVVRATHGRLAVSAGARIVALRALDSLLLDSLQGA